MSGSVFREGCASYPTDVSEPESRSDLLDSLMEESYHCPLSAMGIPVVRSPPVVRRGRGNAPVAPIISRPNHYFYAAGEVGGPEHAV